MSKPKLKTVKRSVKHCYTPEEVATLYVEFRQSYANYNSAKGEFESVKATYKAKEKEAESAMQTLDAKLQAGFELREKPCVRICDLAKGKKHFYLEATIDPESGQPIPLAVPIITEDLTDADRQQELLEAEEQFEKRENIELFKPAGQDTATLTVGRLNGKWFGAVNATIGKNVLKERMDGDQPAAKKRPDAVKLAVKRFTTWVEQQLGKEPAKGFTNAAALVIFQHSEREE